MIGQRLKFSHLKWDKQGYRKKYSERLKQLMYDAIKAFLVECVQHVPVATGMAKQSLRPLANWLSRVGHGTNFSVHPKRTDAWATARYDLGESLGMQGSYLLIRSNQYGISNMTFDWGTDVPHWTIDPGLEWISNPHGGAPAWHAIEKGMKAAYDFINTNSSRYMPDHYDLDISWEDF